MRAILAATDLKAGELADLLELARQVKRYPRGYRDACAGAIVGLAWLSRDVVHRAAVEVALCGVGASTVTVGPEGLDAWAPASRDLGAVLSRYVDALCVAGDAHDDVVGLATESAVPVINARSDRHAPAEALAALLTIYEHRGRVGNMKVAYVGDGGAGAHALLGGGALAGFTVAVAHPRGFAPDPDALTAARDAAALTGGAVLVTEDPAEAVRDADVVVVEPLPGGDRGPSRAQIEASFREYTLDSDLLALARPSALVLHPLPCGPEIDPAIAAAGRDVMLDYAGNRVHAHAALWIATLGRR